mmetsp:Transcript_38941/g.81844  ORF Transcript_38941/g.81844 Transcript_38941/m.81844 type:complete len:347 (+) Transcript_38941:153-1193(+)
MITDTDRDSCTIHYHLTNVKMSGRPLGKNMSTMRKFKTSLLLPILIILGLTQMIVKETHLARELLSIQEGIKRDIVGKLLPKQYIKRPIPNCMVFLHIPKCGGRTSDSFLRSISEGIMKFKRQSNYKSQHATDIQKWQVNQTYTLGHFTTILFEMQPKFRQCFKVTILREPVDRAISAFFFHGHKHAEIDSCLKIEGNISGSTHQTKRNSPGSRCMLSWQYANDMTRQLAGRPDTKWNQYAIDRYSYSSVNGTHLDHAKTNLLKYFDAVCFMHKLPSCVEKVLEAFQVQKNNATLDLSLVYTNKTTNKFKTGSRPASLDSAALEKFRRVNKLDIELYDWALSNILH